VSIVPRATATHALRTTRCPIQTQNVESLGSSQVREPLANDSKRCRNKFLRYFSGGFADQKYIDWERGYKWTAHERWQEILGQEEHRALIRPAETLEVAACAVRIESRDNLLFSFEKMALRDAVKSEAAPDFSLKVFTTCFIPRMNWRPSSPIGARSWRNYPASRRAS
jgi:hypothetical protein